MVLFFLSSSCLAMCRKPCKQKRFACSCCWLKKNGQLPQQRRSTAPMWAHSLHMDRSQQKKEKKRRKMSWMLSWGRLLFNWSMTRSVLGGAAVTAA